MRIVTEEESREMLCPMSFGARGLYRYCAGTKCMWFTETGPSLADWMAGAMDGEENRLYYCGVNGVKA